MQSQTAIQSCTSPSDRPSDDFRFIATTCKTMDDVQDVGCPWILVVESTWHVTGEAVLASRLKLVGSSRNAGDEAAIAKLKQLVAQLGIADLVDFHVNVSFSELRVLLGNAVAGLHTMVDEHFGISVVEYMAAGTSIQSLCLPVLAFLCTAV